MGGREKYLHLNIKYTYTALLSYIFDSLDARAVVITSELGVLDEASLADEGEEGFPAGEVVFAPISLAGPGAACRVCKQQQQ